MATARERLRAATLEDIKTAARQRLAVDGANLSLRAVARDVGLVSSAVYRYFPSRDALLTALIIDSYNDLGSTVEAAEAEVDRADLAGRFTAVAKAVRSWALASPNEYALIFGSPVPGYAAPQDTIAPAARTTTVLAGILTDGVRSGEFVEGDETMDPALDEQLSAFTAQPPFDEIPNGLMARGMAAWSAVFGLVSFELFHAYGPLSAPEELFDHQVRAITRQLGLART